jgi:hypothetical protein
MKSKRRREIRRSSVFIGSFILIRHLDPGSAIFAIDDSNIRRGNPDVQESFNKESGNKELCKNIISGQHGGIDQMKRKLDELFR